jgi:hypothetical protein
VLAVWQARTAVALQPRALKGALEGCGHLRLVDLVGRMMAEPGRDVDEILTPYVQREGNRAA